jgi:hypothetical protein
MDDTMMGLMRLKAKGFCCAQMILVLALESQGKINKDLVRSMGGLCFGIDGAGEACGALSGGACLLSLYSGKGSEEEFADDECGVMLGELVSWFKEAGASEYGGIRCTEILGRFPDRSMCGRIVADTHGKCMEILVSHGYDPATGKEE